jgi:hypothetical protein
MELTSLVYVVSAAEFRIDRLAVRAAVQPIKRNCLLRYPRDASPMIVLQIDFPRPLSRSDPSLGTLHLPLRHNTVPAVASPQCGFNLTRQDPDHSLSPTRMLDAPHRRASSTAGPANTETRRPPIYSSHVAGPPIAQPISLLPAILHARAKLAPLIFEPPTRPSWRARHPPSLRVS